MIDPSHGKVPFKDSDRSENGRKVEKENPARLDTSAGGFIL